MDYLQYRTFDISLIDTSKSFSFKPYYRWITFNTKDITKKHPQVLRLIVLNLIIDGLPSILTNLVGEKVFNNTLGFKPYYRWITFNTDYYINRADKAVRCCFKPYYRWITFNTFVGIGNEVINEAVLNLIIDGLPSIL